MHITMKYYFVYKLVKRMNDEDRMRFDTEELYVKSPEEMIDYFKNIPDAVENTVKIA